MHRRKTPGPFLLLTAVVENLLKRRILTVDIMSMLPLSTVDS